MTGTCLDTIVLSPVPLDSKASHLLEGGVQLPGYSGNIPEQIDPRFSAIDGLVSGKIYRTAIVKE
jgi:hypothetical protein